MAMHEDCQSQEETAAKEAPDFDVMCTAFHWIRNRTRGEERAVHSGNLAFYGKMVTLPASLQQVIKSPQQNDTSQPTPGTPTQDTSCKDGVKLVNPCWIWGFRPCCVTVSPGVAKKCQYFLI